MGNLSHYTSGIWCYKSSGFKTASILIDYFDTFNLFGGKYEDYLRLPLSFRTFSCLWLSKGEEVERGRKVYIMITEGKHLEDTGVIKIKSIANKGSSETSTQIV